MTCRVLISEDAEFDILGIWSYLASKEGVDTADGILSLIEEHINSLASSPERGHFPPELERVNEFNYREIHLLPYRIIYKISGTEVVVHCVIDGRRDIQSLLAERILR